MLSRAAALSPLPVLGFSQPLLCCFTMSVRLKITALRNLGKHWVRQLLYLQAPAHPARLATISARLQGLLWVVTLSEHLDGS